MTGLLAALIYGALGLSCFIGLKATVAFQNKKYRKHQQLLQSIVPVTILAALTSGLGLLWFQSFAMVLPFMASLPVAAINWFGAQSANAQLAEHERQVILEQEQFSRELLKNEDNIWERMGAEEEHRREVSVSA